jgi:MraZ protein
VLVFTGTYERTIDGKQRLAIPADIRGMLTEEQTRSAEESGSNANPATDDKLENSNGKAKSGISLYVSLGDNQVLCIYTVALFNQRAVELDSSNADPDTRFEYERIMYSLSRRVELDKQGRIRVPEQLKDLAKLGNDVVLIGVRDHLEVRNRDEWEIDRQKILDKIKNPLRMKTNQN